MSSSVTVRKCEALEEFDACVTLQREIWGEQDLEVEPASLFVVAVHTGGQVLGAFDGYTLVAFTLALAGLRDGRSYLHSHMTGVRASYRDRGVGRMLKFFQREEALSRGIRLIEWTFDPLEMRNAHFNLNRLGAVCRQYLPNLYGVTSSPLHRGLATDRLVAEWHLDSPRVAAAMKGELPAVRSCVSIEVPALPPAEDASHLERVQTVQASVRKQFLEFFKKGYAAIAVSQVGNTCNYQLAPWSGI